MKDFEKGNQDLMPLEEYKKLRNKAVAKLKDYKMCTDDICIIGDQRIRVKDKDKLLNQLLEGYEYLEVPLELYLTSKFWRTLKVESNIRIRHIKM